MAEKKEQQFPENWHLNACNEFVYALEAQVLEQLMNTMYEAQEKAEKCGCPQCKKWGDSARVRFWTEHHRARSGPDMDHEEEHLMNFALMRLQQITDEKKKKKKDGSAE